MFDLVLYLILMRSPKNAPTIAPVVVNKTRKVPTLMFEILSFTYADADPLDVAITETMDAPIAR